MKIIKLTRGHEALVDDEDYDLVSQYKWHACPKPHGVYAQRGIYIKETKRVTQQLMQSLILSEAAVVDHINGDTLDNRRSNLRAVSHQENRWNCDRPNVSMSGEQWRADIKTNGVHKYLGIHKTRELAIRAWLIEKINAQGVANSYRAIVKFGHLL